MIDHSKYPGPNGGATRFKKYEAPGAIMLVPSKDGKYYPYKISVIEALHAELDDVKTLWNACHEQRNRQAVKLAAANERIAELEKFITSAKDILVECIIIGRGDAPPFMVEYGNDGNVLRISPRLTRYVIIPIEKYGTVIKGDDGKPIGVSDE